jgi:hypothetical protein
VVINEHHRIIDVCRNTATESWLVVHANGRIEHHTENNGRAFLCDEPQTRAQWVDLDYVRDYWPEIAGEVESTVIALGEQQ